MLFPIGCIVVPFCGSYFGSYKVTPIGTATEPMGNRDDGMGLLFFKIGSGFGV